MREENLHKPLTTYKKACNIIGKIAFIGILFGGLIQVLSQFLSSQRGFISATLLTIGFIWGLTEIYDIASKKYGWK